MVRLLPKCKALQCVEAYRSNAMFKCDILRSIFRVVKTLEKKQRNAAEFWVLFSITPILFQCFELGQQ